MRKINGEEWPQKARETQKPDILFCAFSCLLWLYVTELF